MKVAMLDISRATAVHFGVRHAVLMSEDRCRKVARARQVAMVICRQMTSRTLPEIGRHFHRDHTTVLYAIGEVGPGAPGHDEFAADFETIESVVASVASIRHTQEQEWIARLVRGEIVFAAVEVWKPKAAEVVAPPARKIRYDKRLFVRAPRSWYSKLPPSSLAPLSARRLMGSRA